MSAIQIRMLERSKAHAIFAAIVIVFTAGAYAWMFYDIGHSAATHHVQAERKAKQEAASTPDRVERACADRQGTSLRECVTEAVKASQESQRSEADLESQRGMSKWAFWLLIVAGGQLLATAVGLYFISGTLEATRQAVDEAGKATKAALVTADAYVAVERPRLVLSADYCVFDNKRERIIVGLMAENVGKSAAYVERVGSCASFNNGPPGMMALKHVSVAVYPERTTLVGEAEGAQDFHSKRYVSGVVIYRSAFQQEHQAYFCFRIEPGVIDGYGGGGPTAHGDRDGAHWPEDT